MKFILLFILLSCRSEDRLKHFLQTEVLPEEMRAYEIRTYEAIPLPDCRGRKITVVPSETFDMPAEAELGVNLCGSAGCVYYVIADDGKKFELLHEGNYQGLIAAKGECPEILFDRGTFQVK